MIEDILKISKSIGVNKEQYGLWGKTAAKRFLEDGVELTESVRKLASEHNLNSDEINRVCEMANLETYAQLLKTSSPEDKAFEFPVADRASIVQESAKTAMPRVFFTDYDRPTDRDLLINGEGDIFEAFGVVGGQEKLAQCAVAGEAVIQKLERLAEMEKDKVAACLEGSMESAEKFFDMVKQELLAGKDFGEVEAALHAKADSKDKKYGDRIKELVAYAKRRMFDAGLVQSAARTGDAADDSVKTAEPVESSHITDTWESPHVTVSVINGRHPLFACIDTLVTQFEEADKSRNNLIILEDKIRYTKSRVRGKKQPL